MAAPAPIPVTCPTFLSLTVEIVLPLEVPHAATLESSGEELRWNLVLAAAREQVTAEKIHTALQALTVENIKSLNNNEGGIRILTAYHYDPTDADLRDEGDPDQISGSLLDEGILLMDLRHL